MSRRVHWIRELSTFGIVAGLFLTPSPSLGGCKGLTGHEYEQCVAGQPRPGGTATVPFYDAQDQVFEIDRAVVNESMNAVCRSLKRDGLYIAYRNANDHQAGKKWKEVECKGGALTGVWKEYFPTDDSLTVLSYDATGKAVRQAQYYQGRLIRESSIGAPSKP